MILNTEQARALRNADSVCFDYDGDSTVGLGAIRAILLADDKIGAGEQTTTIPGVHSTLHAYDDSRGGFTCFDMIMTAQFTPEWKTVAKRIKAGTDVRLHWVRGNSSPVTDEAGLVVDYLNIVLNGDEYRIGNYVGRDNTTRMVRVY